MKLKPSVLLVLASAALAQSNHESILKNLTFRGIGPAAMGGRVDDFAVVETDPRIIYVGTAAGGIFKTVNGGTTWESIFDSQDSPSIGDIALAPSNPSILYVGTGEANNRQSSSWGKGVFKSMDAGKTWTHVGLANTFHIGRIVVHPTNPDIVLAAALGNLWGSNPDRGLFRSTDGGATWTKILFINDSTGVSDVAIDPQSPNVIFAATYQRQRTVFGFNGGGPDSGLYRSVDGGATWTKLKRGLPSTADIGRCAIDIYRRNSNVIYALIEHPTEGGIYRSDDKGVTWNRMSDTNPRPSYYSQIRIDPNADTRVWVLGLNLQLSVDGGRTFTNRDRGIHPDFHALWIDPTNSDHILAGSDGGVHGTHDGGRTWDFLNNIAIGQFYEVAFDFQRPYHVCGGLQDNNTWCGPSASLRGDIANDEWVMAIPGDGYHVRIDPADPNTVYAEQSDGALARRDLRTHISRSIRPLEGTDAAPRYRFQWNAPLILSPHDPKTLYFGGNYLFKSTDRGDSWVRLGEDLTTNQDRRKLEILGRTADQITLSRHEGVFAWPCITAIAESPVKPGVLWAGTDDGNVQVSRDGGKSWSNVATRFPGMGKRGYVSRIEASYKDAATAYVAFDNHRSADFSVYIYRTSNYGESWQSVSNGISPEAGTVHVIREDPASPNLLFAGTEFGLYVSLNRGQNWERMHNELPSAPVFDLQIHPREHDLIIATHGRSIWILDNIVPLEEIAAHESITSNDLHLFRTRPRIQWIPDRDHNGWSGSRNFLGDNPSWGLQFDCFLKAPGELRVTIADKAGKQVQQYTRKGVAGVNRLFWNMRYDQPLHHQTPLFINGPSIAGSLVDPGDYLVTIAAAGKTETATLTLEGDPRVVISPEDRARRHAAIFRLTTMLREADDHRLKIVAMNKALTGLLDGWKRPGAVPVSDTVRKAAGELAARIKTALPALEDQRTRTGPIPPLFYMPPPLTRKIGELRAEIDSYPVPPTARQLADIEEYSVQLPKAVAEVNQLFNGLAKLNKLMAEAGVPYVTVDTDK